MLGAPAAQKLALHSSPFTQSLFTSSAWIGVHFAAVDVTAIATVVRSGEKRKLGVDAVSSDIAARRTDVEVHPITEQQRTAFRLWLHQNASHHAQCDIGHVVVGTAAVRPAGRIRRRRAAGV